MFINLNNGLDRVALNTQYLQAIYIINDDFKYKVYALMNDAANVKIGEFENVVEAEKYISDITEDLNIPF